MGSVEEAPLFDWRKARNQAGFALRAVRRHWVLALGVFALASGGAVGLFHLAPHRYQLTTTVLAAPDSLAPVIVNPAKVFSRDLTPPLTAAVQAALSSATLAEAVAELRLVDRWDEGRSPPLRFKDRLLERAFGPPTEAARREALVGLLEERLWVTPKEKDGVVEIGIRWPDPDLGGEIVRWIRERFVAARRAQEVAPLTDAHRILQAQLLEAQARADEALARIERARAAQRKGARSATPGGLQAEGTWRAAPDPELMALRTQLLARRREIAELEAERNRRLAALQSKLAEHRAVLGPEHPSIRETESQLEATRRSGPELDLLRGEEQQLLRRFVSLGGKELELQEGDRPSWPKELEEDPRLGFARAQLDAAIRQVAALLERTETARLELASAEASFAARHAVVRPPPSAERLTRELWHAFLGAGLLSGVLLAFAAAVARDLLGGRVVEPWQLEELGAPVLVEVRAS